MKKKLFVVISGLFLTIGAFVVKETNDKSNEIVCENVEALTNWDDFWYDFLKAFGMQPKSWHYTQMYQHAASTQNNWGVYKDVTQTDPSMQTETPYKVSDGEGHSEYKCSTAEHYRNWTPCGHCMKYY